MNKWVFSSNTLENIRVAKERPLWGFWDREAGEKQRKNWRNFIRLYNRIKPFDTAVFQIARTGQIHAIGIIKEKFYDDQTPVWPNEGNKVLFLWKVSFSTITFSEEPFVSNNVTIDNYIDGRRIRQLQEHEFRRVLEQLRKILNIGMNLG